MERADKALLLVKIEATKGTDAEPAAATEVIITQGMPEFAVVGSRKERSQPLAYFGAIAGVNIGEALTMKFKTELKGSGTKGTASRYGCLFQACNFTEAATAGTSVVYTPNSVFAGKSVSFYFHMDGTRHVILGAVGTFKITFKPQEIAVIEWEFTGLYAGNHASTVTFPSPTHEAIAPLFFKGAGFTYNSVSTLVIDELTLDLGNTISKQTDGNAATGIKSYFVSQRAAKGNMKIEKEALATLDPWTIYNSNTQANIALTLNGGEGNTVAFAITGTQLNEPKYGDREKVAMWDLDFTINPTLSAGNNEIVITFT
jgi:hypothetical protein